MSCQRKIRQQQQQQQGVNEEQPQQQQTATTPTTTLTATKAATMLSVPSSNFIGTTSSAATFGPNCISPRTTPGTPASVASTSSAFPQQRLDSATLPRHHRAESPARTFIFPPTGEPQPSSSASLTAAAPDVSTGGFAVANLSTPGGTQWERRISPGSLAIPSPLPPALQSASSISACASRFGSFALPNNPDEDGAQDDEQLAEQNPQRWYRGPLGCLGLGQLLLGLCLCCVDALTNPLSQSRFCMSASMLAVACAVLCFVSASRWPDQIALWLLLPVCPCSSLLWICLCAESAHQLIHNTSTTNFHRCPSPMPRLAWSWLETERQAQLRPCLGWMLHSLLLCAALIGVFFSLCSLLICCRSLRPVSATSHTPPIALSARRPFSLLIAPAGRQRPKPIRLPLIKTNGAVMTGAWATMMANNIHNATTTANNPAALTTTANADGRRRESLQQPQRENVVVEQEMMVMATIASKQQK